MLNAATQPAPTAPLPDLERIFRENANLVLAAAYRITGNAHDAEDVLQTVFMRIVRRERGAKLSENPAPYLQRAAVNAGLDVLRSRANARSTPLDDVEPMLADSPKDSPDRLQDAAEIRQQVRAAMTRLSPRAAEIFSLRYCEGYDNHEIARMLGTSRSTVAVVLHRARHTLREEIGQFLGDKP